MEGSLEREGYAYFTVTSPLPLATIVSHMGMDGERRSWSIGDVRGSGGKYSFSRWSLQSGISKGRPLNEHLRALWLRMSALDPAARSLPAGMTAWVQCVARFASCEDTLAIAAGHFATAAYFQASIDCDFYFDDGFGEEGGRAYWDWRGKGT